MAASSVTPNFVDFEKVDQSGTLITKRYEEGYQGKINLLNDRGEILFTREFTTFEDLFDFQEENLHGYSGVSLFKRSFSKVRTDTISNYLGDMLMPTVTNHAIKVESLGYKIFAVTLASAWDILTMIPRGLSHVVEVKEDIPEPLIPQCIHQDDPELVKVLSEEPITVEIFERSVRIDETPGDHLQNNSIKAFILKRKIQYPILMNPTLSAPIQRIRMTKEKTLNLEGARDKLTGKTYYSDISRGIRQSDNLSYSFFSGMQTTST